MMTSHTPTTASTLRTMMGLSLVLFMNACLVAAPRNMGATGDPKGDEKGAKPAATNETYIEQWQDEAIRQMQKYGIPVVKEAHREQHMQGPASIAVKYL